MKKTKKPPLRWTVTPLLLAAAAFFRFAVRGYGYIGYTLAFAAALVAANSLLPRPWWRIIAVAVCVGALYFAAVEVMIIRQARTDPEPERDYLVVLGAAVHGDTLSLALSNRLEGALEYLERYPESTAILSGGRGPGENMSEAKAMYDWLIGHGIPPERLIMEDRATSTDENLRYSFDIIRSLGAEPDGNVALLSSAYHLYRAKAMAAMQGVGAAGVAGAPDYPITTLNYFIREAFGVTHLWVFGR